MAMFWWGFGTALFLVLVVRIVYVWLINLYGVQWYRVVDVKPMEAQGLWHVKFILGDYFAYGYCKKEPPHETDGQKLMVRVKHFNEKRGLYHLHWELLEDNKQKRKKPEK